jgi:hypothetical protein
MIDHDDTEPFRFRAIRRRPSRCPERLNDSPVPASEEGMRAPSFRASAALVLALAAGCASQPVPEAREGWQDAAYDDVVLAWGTPTRSALLSDGRYAYTWVSEGSLPRTGVSPSIGIGVGSGGIGIGTGVVFGGAGAEFARCERMLIFEGGRVVDQAWQGPTEYCNTFARVPAPPR